MELHAILSKRPLNVLFGCSTRTCGRWQWCPSWQALMRRRGRSCSRSTLLATTSATRSANPSPVPVWPYLRRYLQRACFVTMLFDIWNAENKWYRFILCAANHVCTCFQSCDIQRVWAAETLGPLGGIQPAWPEDAGWRQSFSRIVSLVFLTGSMRLLSMR